MSVTVKTLSAIHRAIYSATGGKVGNRIAGMPVLLLTTVGRKTGMRRTSPLTYFEEDGAIVLVGSYGGRPRNPDWFDNLIAAGEGEVTIGRESRRLQARRATADERARLWPRIVETYDGYAKYQTKTEREIPLALLTAPKRGATPSSTSFAMRSTSGASSPTDTKSASPLATRATPEPAVEI